MRPLRLESIFVSNVGDSIRDPIKSHERKLPPDHHSLVFGAGVLQLALLLGGGAVAGLVPGAQCYNSETVSTILTDSCIHRARCCRSRT